MPRLKTRKLLTVLIVSFIIFFILSLSRSYQPHLMDTESINFSFTRKILSTVTMPIAKIFYAQSLSAETNNNSSYELVQDIIKFGFKSKLKTKSVKNKNNYAVVSGNTNKLWFMKDGIIRPEPVAEHSTVILWPNQDKGDRIVQQLMYVPANYKNGWDFSLSGRKNLFPSVINKQINLKKIAIYFGINKWPDLPHGRRVFVRDKCPVNTCSVVDGFEEAHSADAVLFRNKFVMPKFRKSHHQVWILYLLECPLNTQSFRRYKNVINWTATYRRDSDIVTPYEKFVPYNVTSLYSTSKNLTTSVNHDYAAAKKKKVAWFVSNCNARNKRLQYAYELSNFIKVDIYGSCGINYCPRQFNKMCMERLEKTHKFYLAFENSNCKDYITEKFFRNGLGYNLIPIVMGARRQDYDEVAPPHSFIHVDDFASPKELADYLHVLDGNDTLYNEYFAWKDSGEFINTYFWCRLCALLHAPYKPKSYSDIHKWWAKRGTCDV